MKIDNKGGPGKGKSIATLQATGCSVTYDDMKSFLRKFGKTRVELLDYLHRCGPSSTVEIATRLRRRKTSIICDLVDLVAEDLVEEGAYGLYYVTWQEIYAEVQHKNRSPAKNVKNLADWYLFLSARKYSWLKVKIKLRVIERGTPTFSCSLTPVINDKMNSEST